MSHTQSNPLLDTIGKIFSNTSASNDSRPIPLAKRKKTSKAELELAMTVLLVDLATCDEKFQPEEYQLIANGLRRLFGTSRHQVQALVNQSNQVLRNLRGTASFANLLRDNLSESERLSVMEVIDEIIEADGHIDGFEIYIRHKLAALLDIPLHDKSPTNQ